MQALNDCRRKLRDAGIPMDALLFPVLAAPPSLLWMAQTNLQLKWDVALMVAANWLLLVACTIYCAIRPGLRLLASISGSFLALLFTLAAVSLPSVLPLVLPERLWDVELRAWDAALGIDHVAFLRWLTGLPVALKVLEVFYFSTMPLMVLTPLVLMAYRRYDRLHEVLWLYVWTLAAVVAIAAFFPARGMFSGLPLPADIRALLPAAAGDYHLRLVEPLISGEATVFDIASNPGSIVFPSFHLCMAAILALAFRGIRYFNVAGIVAAVLIAVSIVPIGGHYVVDGLASIPVLAAVFAIYRRVQPPVAEAKEQVSLAAGLKGEAAA
jgi:hypothetical protein